MSNLTERAIAHFPNQPNYQAAWLRMVNLLGNRWLLANRIRRLT